MDEDKGAWSGPANQRHGPAQQLTSTPAPSTMIWPQSTRRGCANFFAVVSTLGLTKHTHSLFHLASQTWKNRKSKRPCLQIVGVQVPRSFLPKQEARDPKKTCSWTEPRNSVSTPSPFLRGPLENIWPDPSTCGRETEPERGSDLS